METGARLDAQQGGLLSATELPTKIAFNKIPSPMPLGMTSTQIPDPQWGKYNDAELANIFETHSVEL